MGIIDVPFNPAAVRDDVRTVAKLYPTALAGSPKSGNVARSQHGLVVVKDKNGTGRHIGFPGSTLTVAGKLCGTWRDATVGVPTADQVETGVDRGLTKMATANVWDPTSWSADATVFDANDLAGTSLAAWVGADARESVLAVAPNGTVVLFVTIAGLGGDVLTRKVLMIPSPDGGVTFPISAIVDLGAASGYAYTKVLGRPVLLSDGVTWLVPITTYLNGADTFRSTVATRVTTGNWSVGTTVTVANGQADSINYDEPIFLTTETSGEIVCLSRNLNTDTRRIRSTDSGATWGTPTISTTAIQSVPRCIRLTSGAFVMVGRDAALNDTVVLTSWDKGVTWSAVSHIDPNAYYHNYGTLIEPAAGQVALIYAVAPDSTHTSIYFDVLTDGYGVDCFGSPRFGASEVQWLLPHMAQNVSTGLAKADGNVLGSRQPALVFDGTTAEEVLIPWICPAGWTTIDILVKHGTVAGFSSGNKVAFNFWYGGNGDLGTVATGDDVQLWTNQLLTIQANGQIRSATVTTKVTVAAGTHYYFRIQRDPTQAGDNHNNDYAITAVGIQKSA